ncbi:MAG: UDP-N-acetylmuramate dehydrogenase [Holosporaceae bacterium]|jgi:UDP-N-acetylmuramate dehydrogenase|nr:UDP-N-acetylmuramate dehydrogenase [Holosporaceae bacterium]
MSIVDKFPPVNGRLQENIDLGKKSFFGTTGIVEVLFIPRDINDLTIFLSNIPENIPLTILGSMSNILIRSGGIKGVVIILGDWFSKIFVENGVIEAGAAVKCTKLSATAMNNGLGGFEFLIGIPGTIGGAIKMNAGCYGSEISDVLIEYEGINSSGNVKWFKSTDQNFAYRDSQIPDDIIVTRAWFRGTENVNYSISKKINEIIIKRKDTQPFNQKSCGSMFKNPEGKRAWELIEAAGCRGMKLGGAMVSEKHCNFVVNESDATADDIEDLGELVAKKVFENSGINLEWEILRLGIRRNEGSSEAQCSVI